MLHLSLSIVLFKPVCSVKKARQDHQKQNIITAKKKALIKLYDVCVKPLSIIQRHAKQVYRSRYLY